MDIDRRVRLGLHNTQAEFVIVATFRIGATEVSLIKSMLGVLANDKLGQRVRYLATFRYSNACHNSVLNEDLECASGGSQVLISVKVKALENRRGPSWEARRPD